MLKQRVITAVALLFILLPALFYPSPKPFCVVALILIAAGSWEWGRLNGYSQLVSFATAFLVSIVCLIAWVIGLPGMKMPFLWGVIGVSWIFLWILLLYRGVLRWSEIPSAVRLLTGSFVLCLAWLAIVQARILGINFLLSVLVLVWAADISAYFAGRAFGGKFSRGKLAPSISPGKTWEGVWGGMIGVVAVAFIWRLSDILLESISPSFYTLLAERGALFFIAGVISMVAMSVVGDLVESLVKRSAGVKDSSGLLPGHGGVLDRVDALLPTLPLAMMFISI